MRAVGAIAFGIVGVGVALFAWFVSWYLSHENCPEPNASKWPDDCSAAEWDQITTLGFVFMAAAIGVAFMVYRHPVWIRWALLAMAIVVAVPLHSLLNTASADAGANFAFWLVLGLATGSCLVAGSTWLDTRD